MIFRCGRCDAKWSGHRVEHCTSCHLTFSGAQAGDKHRVGPMSGRRCLDVFELTTLRTKAGEFWFEWYYNAYGEVIWGRRRPDTRWDAGRRDSEAQTDASGREGRGSA